MKTINLFLSLLLSHAAICQNKLTAIDKSQKVSLLEIFWLIEPENVKMFHSEGDYFYKSFIIFEGETGPEGEGKEKLY